MKRIFFVISIYLVFFNAIASANQTDSIAEQRKQHYKTTTIDQSNMNNREQSTNALDAIRGRVAGMTIEKNGQNALSAVRLRGTTSLTAGNDPLIIVDGVLGDLSLLESIYPTDIESFTIKKDASETAQYGSRGASGVIEIQTIRGKQGNLHIKYNSNLSVGSVYKRLNMLSADEYRQFCKQTNLAFIDKGYSTNWQKQIERTAISHQHHLAFSGGTEKTYYRASVGYMDNQQVIRNLGSRTFMSNMNLTQYMFQDILKIDIGMFGSVQKERQLFGEQKMLYSAACFNPTFDANSTEGYSAASQLANPNNWLNNSVEPENAHISTNLNLDFKLLSTLHLKLFGAYTYRFGELSEHLPTEAGGTNYRSTDKQQNMLGNISLDYSQKWNNHALSATVLAEIQSNIRSGYYTTTLQSSTNLLSYDKLSAGSLRLWEGTDSYRTDANMLSFMGKVGYTLLDRYSLNASIRCDGSSKFGKNNRWGFFPSVSATWILSNEEWLSSVGLIDDLRLTAGYGMSGNQSGIDSYLTQNLFSPNGTISENGVVITTFAQLRNQNPYLKWEVNRTANVGADASLFNGRLLLNLSYYYTAISDMLYPYQVSTPPYSYPTLVANLGSMRNQGIEFSVGGTAYKSQDWELTINANLTWQQNKLLSLNGYLGDTYLYAADYNTISSLSGAGSHGGDNDIVWQVVGQPLGVFYIPTFTGMTENSTSGYSYGAGEKKILGQATPKLLLGSNISLRYKDLDLSIQLNGAFGHKIFNGTSLAYMNLSALPYYNVLQEAISQNIYDQKVTDYWLEKGDYLNIDYITLGYKVPLPQNKVVESMRLVATMNNVATITAYSGLTPMINSSNISSGLGVDDKHTYPLYHTYTFGVSIAF